MLSPLVHAGQAPGVPVIPGVPGAPGGGVALMEAGTFVVLPAIFAGTLWGLRGAVWGGLAGALLFAGAYWMQTSALGTLFGQMSAAPSPSGAPVGAGSASDAGNAMLPPGP